LETGNLEAGKMGNWWKHGKFGGNLVNGLKQVSPKGPFKVLQ